MIMTCIYISSNCQSRQSHRQCFQIDEKTWKSKENIQRLKIVLCMQKQMIKNTLHECHLQEM